MKILISLFLFVMAQAAAVNCPLGSLCQIPVDDEGHLGNVEFNIPGPYVDENKVGDFTCRLQSDNTMQLIGLSVATDDNSASNYPVLNYHNLIVLYPNTQTPFSITWQFPGKPHPGIQKIALHTQDMSRLGQTQERLFIICDVLKADISSLGK